MTTIVIISHAETDPKVEIVTNDSGINDQKLTEAVLAGLQTNSNPNSTTAG
jgi:hypothetical protein